MSSLIFPCSLSSAFPPPLCQTHVSVLCSSVCSFIVKVSCFRVQHVLFCFLYGVSCVPCVISLPSLSSCVFRSESPSVRCCILPHGCVSLCASTCISLYMSLSSFVLFCHSANKADFIFVYFLPPFESFPTCTQSNS